MSIAGVLLGVINIFIVVALLLLVGVFILWIVGLLGMAALPDQARKLYIAIVALIALYLFVALIFGLPGLRILPL